MSRVVLGSYFLVVANRVAKKIFYFLSAIPTVVRVILWNHVFVRRWVTCLHFSLVIKSAVVAASMESVILCFHHSVLPLVVLKQRLVIHIYHARYHACSAVAVPGHLPTR